MAHFSNIFATCSPSSFCWATLKEGPLLTCWLRGGSCAKSSFTPSTSDRIWGHYFPVPQAFAYLAPYWVSAAWIRAPRQRQHLFPGGQFLCFAHYHVHWPHWPILTFYSHRWLMHWHTWFALMSWQQPHVLGHGRWKRQLTAEGWRRWLRQSPARGLRSLGKCPSRWFGLTHVRWRDPLERAAWPPRSPCAASSWPPSPLWSFWPVWCLVPSCTAPSGISNI